MRNLTQLRRDFHRYPESGWTEFRTTVRIIEELQTLDLEVHWGPDIHTPEKMYGLPPAALLDECWQRAAKETGRDDLLLTMKGGFTGCIAEIRGALPGPTTAIRVDIDCCDVSEAADPGHRPAALGFASCHPGCMHACGHDAHAAIGIGAARLLVQQRQKLRGTVRLIFQPAEEGLRGSASMTAAGAVEGCSRLFGLHVGIRDLPFGTVAASCTGFLSSTKFDALFHGVPAHAGIAPEQGRNALAAGARATLDLLDIPSRHTGLCRVNVGTFHAGSGRNVIPAEAVLTIETRGGSAAINSAAEQEALALCRSAAERYGCSFETRFMGAAGDAACDPELVQKTIAVLERIKGVTSILPAADFGAGEDVTTMMRAVQAQGGAATHLLLGMPLPAPHHSSRFDIDERVLELGARILAAFALSE